MVKIKFSHIDPKSKEALKLTEQLFEDLEYNDARGSVDDFLEENSELKTFLIAITKKGETAASGALKHHNDNTVEIKRMYVVKEHRGEGISKQILYELEKLSGEMGYKRIILQTGIKQPEAVNLYKQNKYKKIDCFGKYVDNPESVCFEKKLK